MDGLKHLLKSYYHKIKCIYIDPPYNTGSDGFVYNDNFNFTPQDLTTKLSIDEDQAKRILDLTKRESASHSAWLLFMYPRLVLARDLLTEDGVIFVSIDDNEQANLKLLCDDVFGEENFIANIIVQANKRGQTYKQLAKTHEYMFVYTSNIFTKLNELEKGNGSFDKKDKISEFEERELRNRNPKFGKFNRPNLFYPIYTNPREIDECGYCPVSLEKTDSFSVEILPYNSDGEESCWRWGKAKFMNNNNQNASMESDLVARQKNTGEFGCYEKYRKGTYKAKTIWYEDNLVGELFDEDDDIWEETGVITEQGSKELGEYDMSDAFDFPKPTYLIKKALKIGMSPDDFCLDFFSGSGTTAESILSLNSEDNGNRKFIVVQLPEDLDLKFEKSTETEKAKVKKVLDFLDSVNRKHTLDQVGIERIERAGKRIKNEQSNGRIDVGFKHFTLKEPESTILEELERFDPNDKTFLSTNGILSEFGEATVLATWLIKDGYGFSMKTMEIDFDGYKAYYAGKHLYLINSGITQKAIESIVTKMETDGSFNPENIVIFGYSFAWTELENLKTNLMKLYDSEKHLKVNFDVRY